NETVSFCKIGSKINDWGICGFHAYNFSFQDISLAPGSSTEVFLGTMYDYGYCIPGNDSSIIYPLSLHSRIPNNKIDRNISNNQFTTSFVIDLNIGIGEQNFLNVKIYPNPCDEFVKIENPRQNRLSWSLYSPVGRTLLHGTYDASQTLIDVSDIDEGIYILNLYSDNGQTHSEKLLIK
ncbi:MAG: T9SS type A sorting domain-containing protein, partial [Bacteroidales bacterium]